MDEITWTKLKAAHARDIKDGPCLKVTADGETIGYLIIKPEGIMRNRIEGIASQINAGRGAS